MRKFRALVGFALCVVLLLGGVLPNLSTVHADEAGSQADEKQLKLKIVDDDIARVSIKRVDEEGKTLYTGLDKRDLPRNATVRITLQGHEDGKYIVDRVDVEHNGKIETSKTYDELSESESINIHDGDVVKIVYKPTEDDFYPFDVTYYDYDYSSPDGEGINAASNYPESDESQRLQMGIADGYHEYIVTKTVSGSDGNDVEYKFGSTLGSTNYETNVITERPDGQREVANANVNNGVWGEDGNGGINNVLWPIVTGLVTDKLDDNGNPVWGKTADGKQLVDPGFFTSAPKLGKHIYESKPEGSESERATLDYERNGYHYVLKRANVYDEKTYVKGRDADNKEMEVSNPRFFPLDKVESAEGQMFVDPWHDDNLPDGVEDYEPHNWYFAIRQEVTFQVGQYEGPMNYTFEGDDDLWVFLDGKLVLDLGGMHSVYPNAYRTDSLEGSWSNKVDIREKLEDTGDPDWRNKEHKITIFYMERGGYDSNCYMELTLPIREASALKAVIDIPAETVVKGMENAIKDGNFNPDTDNKITVKVIEESASGSDNPKVIAEKEISFADGQKVTFSDVPLEDGKRYTVQADKIQDFAGPDISGNVSDGFILTYEYQPETRDIPIRKVWDDSVIAAGKGTDSIQVRVLADGEQYGELITLDKAHDWETTISNLQVRKNKEEIKYTIEEVNIPEGIIHSITGDMDKGFVITNNMNHPITHTFVKKSSDMPDLPEEIKDMCPPKTEALGGSTVSPTQPKNLTVAVADGTWKFEGYDKDAVTVAGPVNFVGTWSFEPKFAHKVTYEFVSGTPDKELPESVTKYKWNDTIAMEGEKVSAKEPQVTSVDVGPGFWEFQKWDNEGEVTVTDADVHFIGTWNYRNKNTYNVTHVFVSGSDGKELPAEVVALTPKTPATALEGDVISPTPFTPTIYEVHDEDNHPIGYWTFRNWDAANITVQKDVTFTGTWVYAEYPTYNVTYEFYSDTAEYPNLPQEVMNTKPSDTVVHRGDNIKPAQPSESRVEVKDGVWTFIEYDEADAEENITVDGDITFHGKWHFEPKPEYEVIYIYKSGTPGKNLPSAITEQLPESVWAMEGTEVIPKRPQMEEVKVEDGVWKFYGYDKQLEVADGEDDKFTGTWIFKPDYQITYRFESGTEGYDELPDTITALLPESTTASEGERVTTEQLTYPDVEDKENGGVWQFKEWTPKEITVEKDEEFVGTWTFAKWNVTYEFVSGTSGRNLPPGVVDYLPKPGTVPIGSTVSAQMPEVTRVETQDGYWDFEKYDKNDAKVTSDVKFTGTWRYTAKPTYKVSYSFVSGTEGRTLPKQVLDALPRTVEGLKNNTAVKPAQPLSSSVSVPGGIWKFVSWDKTSLTINGRDATFIGTWTFTANTTANSNNNSNNNTNNNSQPTNTTNPVSPKTGETTTAETYVAATLAMVAGTLVYYKKKEHKAR